MAYHVRNITKQVDAWINGDSIPS